MKISVIIPMYNSSKTIMRALDSIKNQTYKCDYQIIVINDGSDDNGADIVNKYILDNQSLEGNFKIILINQLNSGVSTARNRGLYLAEGDYIAFLDSDDYWLTDKIKIQVNYFNENLNFDFICGLRNNERIKFPYSIQNDFSYITTKKLLFRVVGQTSTAIFKKKIIENTGYFDENQKYSEDANYWMRISNNNTMIIINQMLAKTDNDYGQAGLSSNLIEMENGVRKNIKEMYDLKFISFFEFSFFSIISYIKYLKRSYL